MIENGERDANAIVSSMKSMIAKAGLFRIQYVEIVDAETLSPVDKIKGKVMIALAAFIGKARLIDNIIITA